MENICLKLKVKPGKSWSKFENKVGKIWSKFEIKEGQSYEILCISACLSISKL
jgi:hypothetical protein